MPDQEIDELKKKVEKHERFISRLIEIMENEGECPNNDDYGQHCQLQLMSSCLSCWISSAKEAMKIN